METRHTISAMIPTLNRPAAVVDVVRDLLRQDVLPQDIVIVDQSETVNHELEQMAKVSPIVKVIRTTIRGTCHARNLGIAAATGDIVVFLDDDVRLTQPSFLRHHLSAYADETIGGVGGRVLDKNTALNREQTGRVCTVTRTGRIFANASSTVRQDINAPRGGNMSFRRPAIIEAGPFDEAFRGNAMREETDFSLRVVQHGWRILYEPAAEVLHLGLAGGSRSADRITWYRDFFFNESYFFLKHFSRWYLPLLLGRKLRPIFACAFYYGRGRWSAIRAPWQSFADAWRLTHQRA
ncbi:MAG: glycosyltransferase family 2 protein [Candidatus Kerfeldbacteria bacterium]|nr:glycosyltransferase family 2 protein [Candidatus Kerfeldbacteria bacterium]